MIAPEDIAAAPPVIAKPESGPNYLVATIAGVIAALLLMPLRRIFVSGTYAAGYYQDFPILICLIGAVIGLAVRFGGGNKASWRIAFLAVGLTLFSLLVSEYLFFHSLLNQYYGIEQGYGELPLLLNPLDMVSILIDAFLTNPIDLFLILVSLVAAFFLSVVSDLRGGYSAAASASQRARTVPRAVSMDAPAIAPQPINIPPDAKSIDPTDIPTEAITFGSPLRSYSTGMPSLILPVILCVIGLIFGAAAVFIPEARTPFVIIGAIPLLFGIVKLIQAMIATDDQVLVFQKGLAVTLKDKTETLEWTEISKLYEYKYRYSVNGIPVQDVHDFTLNLKDGRKLVIGKRFKKLPELGEILHAKTVELILPVSIEAFKRGETVDFDIYRINREGIQMGTEITPWSEVRDMRIYNGNVQIDRHGKNTLFSRYASVGKIANMRVFFMMMEDIMTTMAQRVTR